MTDPGIGCFQIMQNLFFAIAALFSFNSGEAAKPLTIEPLEPTFMVHVAPSVDSFTQEELVFASAIIDARLMLLDLLLEPTVVDGDTLILSLSDTPDEDLLSVGFLEFVDFSGIENTIAYDGQSIATSGQLEQYGKMLRPDAQGNPATTAPFETVITNNGIATMSAQASDFGGWIIEFEFTADGSTIIGDFTENHLGESLAIVVDGVVITAPIIQSRLDTAGIITGDFTEQEARNLAAMIQTDALPFAFEILSVEVVE